MTIKSHHAEIIVTDVNNNKSSLSFQCKGTIRKSHNVQKNIDKNLKVMPYNRINKFASENISGKYSCRSAL